MKGERFLRVACVLLLLLFLGAFACAVAGSSVGIIIFELALLGYVVYVTFSGSELETALVELITGGKVAPNGA